MQSVLAPSPHGPDMTSPDRQIFDFDRVNYVVDFAHGSSTEILFSRVLTRESGQPYNFVDFVRVPPGSDIAFHRHASDNQEIYVIIAGTGRMRLEDREYPAGPGSLFVNPPGGAHGLTNTGPAELRLIVIEVPVAAGAHFRGRASP